MRHPRHISIRQLNRGAVPCYVCDGAADPSSAHRVYLFHFPRWNAFKVGITNTGNDRRLETHAATGGVLVETIQVPHRGAALWVEDEVLAAVRPWPVTGHPFENRVDGWTEMWDDRAPVTITLDEYSGRAAQVSLNPDLITVWNADRARGELRTADTRNLTDTETLTLEVGDRVCFTGRPGRNRDGEVGPLATLTRPGWHERARKSGLHPTTEVTPALTALIYGEVGAGATKLAAARTLGVPVISYSTFEMLRLSIRPQPSA